MNVFIVFVVERSRRKPPNEERFARNLDIFSSKIGTLDIIGNFNLQLLHIRKPSTISEVSDNMLMLRLPLHFTQNMNLEFLKCNN